MDILNNEFLLFLKCAQKNDLRYMLIGGYAVNYYEYNRNTDDMDVWLAPRMKTSRRLSTRSKDLWDIARLEELRNLKKD